MCLYIPNNLPFVEKEYQKNCESSKYKLNNNTLFTDSAHVNSCTFCILDQNAPIFQFCFSLSLLDKQGAL